MKKICTKCGIPKDIKEFNKDNQKCDNLSSNCKKCCLERVKIYNKSHKEEKCIYDNTWRKIKRNKLSELKKQYYRKNKENIKIQAEKYNKQYPWKRTLSGIIHRCNHSGCSAYHRYGGRGIKCLITEEELKDLWFRDKAYLMKKPTIDREDNDGNYEYSNCSYIEHYDNTGKAHSKIIIQYNLNGDFIKEYKSGRNASQETKLDYKHISSVANGISQTGFIWKYKGDL